MSEIDGINYNILDEINKENNNQIIDYKNNENKIEVSTNTMPEQSIKRIKSKGQIENKDIPPSLREIITFSNEDLRKAESNLYDSDGKLKDSSDIVSKINGNFRKDQIYNEALTYGINSGLYAKSYQYKKFFEDENVQKELDQIFFFDYLLLFNGRVQPPILVESEDIFIKKNDTKTHEIKKSYMFKEQAKVVSSAKSWRDYIYPLLNINKPEVPHELLLPRTEDEFKEWENGVKDGWEKGEKLARDNIIYKLRVLGNDLLGMIRYKTITQQNIITEGISSEIPISVSSNEDNTSLNIGEKIFELNKLPKFNPDSESWKALPQIKNLIIGDEYNYE